MPSSDANSAVVLELAEEFLQRYRQGERPALREYTDRHPDGRLLAVIALGTTDVDIFDMRLGKRLFTFPERGASVWWMEWSPDGSRLAAFRSDGGVALWDLPAVRAALATLELAP